MADLAIYADEELPADIKCQILSFHRILWWEDFVAENQLRDWIQSPQFHQRHVVLVERGVLISYAGVAWKHLEHAGDTYKTYGLSGVLTYPAFRRQGYGRQVVDAATALIRDSDADIGLFTCAPNLSPFYAASGWIPMEDVILLCGPRNAPLQKQESTMMGFFTEKGKRGRLSFESVPIYFGYHLW